MLRVIALGLVSTQLALSPRAYDQSSDEQRYRWPVKIDTSLVLQPVTPTSIAAILTEWAPLRLTHRDDDAPRTGRELEVFSLLGWVRRARDNEDGDLHVTLTGRPDAPRDSCIVAEIPAARFGVAYQKAREELFSLLRGARFRKTGELRAPVLLRFTGAAFFDGNHQKGGRRRSHAEGHGDCNASASALWELHPVYKVEPPR